MLVPASQLSSPGVSPFPAPLAPLPGSCRVPSVSAVCPCSGALVCFVFFFCISTARHSSLPTAFRSVLCHPPCPPAVSSLSSPLSWVGGGEGGGGGGGRPRCLSSGVSTSRARCRHEARHLSLCRGGGVLPCGSRRRPSYPAVAPPGGPPVGACTARAPFGHGRVVRPAPSLRCLPTLPLCPRGGVPLSAPPYLHPPPSGGRWCWGGGGALVVLPLQHACRRHYASTTQARGEALGCSGGGGFLLWGPLTPEVGYLTSVSCGLMSPRPPPVRCGVGPCLPAFFPRCVGLLCFFFPPPPAARLSSRRVGLSSAPPHVPSPSPRCPRPFPGWVGE